MTDEEFEQSKDELRPGVEHDAPTVPVPGAPSAAIPMPPVPTPTGGAPTGTPSGEPASSYALGALAGNPRLGESPDPVYGGPPTSPGLPFWPAPPGPITGATPPSGTHRFRNVAAITGATVIALAAGIGVGHAAWKNNTTSPTSSHAASASPSGSGSGGNSTGGQGSLTFPFGSGSGTGSSGSSNASTSTGPKDASAIAEKVDPGLVDIDTTLGYQSEQAAGTGIVLTPTGEILTNNHVIDGATTISVTDVGNSKTYTASVVGYDRSRDIAVLQLHNASGLQTATFGNSSVAAVGEDVVGIGNAGGTGGTPSYAGGTVTALDQTITASDEGDGSSEQLTDLIQTNADIQPGDSGGSLVNSSAQVIGIDTAASAGTSFESPDQASGNEGYAIPINEAITIAHQIESGDASSTVHIGPTGFLGVEIAPPSNQGDQGGGFGGGSFGGSSTAGGADVAGVITSSPAQEAGLADGDVITSLNGQNISSADALTNSLEPFHPGDKVTIGWTDSSGATHTATVALTSGPPQ